MTAEAQTSTSRYSVEADLTVVRGRAASGKTTALVRKACALLESGENARDIILFAATRQACSLIEDAFAGIEARNRPRITTMPEFQLAMLGDPSVATKTGRQGRTLLKYEENMLMEDMKTSGVHTKRLKGMLDFFHRSWADLEVMDGAWFYNDEEENVYNSLRLYLDFYGGYLEDEVARASYDWTLASEPDKRRRIKHVFVDDFQLLSRASQCLACLLASDTLWIAGDEANTTSVVERFPNRSGIDELISANAACRIIELDACHQNPLVRDAVESIRTAGEQNQRDSPFHELSENERLTILSSRRPKEEFIAVAEYVKKAIENGAAPEAISIAAPNATWARNMEKALAMKNTPAAFLSKEVFGGDVRSLDRCEEARLITLIKIAANPSDQLALRCWCGFGDHIASSGIIRRIVESEGTLSLECGIKWPKDQEPDDALSRKEIPTVIDRMKQARYALRIADGLRGVALVDALARTVNNTAGEKEAPFARRIRTIAHNAGEDCDASTICEALSRVSRGLQQSGAGTLVGLYDDFPGNSPSLVIVCGLVNGLIPNRNYFDPTVIEIDKKPDILKKCSERVYACAGKAQEQLVLSYFTEATLAEAELLKLKSYRVRLKNGERICEIHPSETIRSITGAKEQ